MQKNWDVRKFLRGLSNQAKKIKLPFEKYDKMYKKKKNTCILKLLIVGPSCEECPSDKGIEFLLITYLCVCVCARVLIYKIIRISKIKAKLLRRAHTIFLCFFFFLYGEPCVVLGVFKRWLSKSSHARQVL